MIKKTSKIICEKFELPSNLMTEIQCSSYFKEVYSKEYQKNMYMIPKIMLLVKQLFKNHYLNSIYYYMDVLKFILGNNYQLENACYRLNNFIEKQVYLSYMSPIYSEAIDYGISISMFEMTSQNYALCKPPNPFIVVFSILIGDGYLPSNIWNSDIKYNNIPLNKILTYTKYSHYEACWKTLLPYSKKITGIVILDILNVISHSVNEPFKQKLRNLVKPNYDYLNRLFMLFNYINI
jgi:hypothetical protein